MNWIGGVRNRVRNMNDEEKKQREFFERKNLAKRVKRANSSNSLPEQKKKVSRDLLHLQCVKQTKRSPFQKESRSNRENIGRFAIKQNPSHGRRAINNLQLGRSKTKRNFSSKIPGLTRTYKHKVHLPNVSPCEKPSAIEIADVTDNEEVEVKRYKQLPSYQSTPIDQLQQQSTSKVYSYQPNQREKALKRNLPKTSRSSFHLPSPIDIQNGYERTPREQLSFEGNKTINPYIPEQSTNHSHHASYYDKAHTSGNKRVNFSMVDEYMSFTDDDDSNLVDPNSKYDLSLQSFPSQSYHRASPERPSSHHRSFTRPNNSPQSPVEEDKMIFPISVNTTSNDKPSSSSRLDKFDGIFDEKFSFGETKPTERRDRQKILNPSPETPQIPFQYDPMRINDPQFFKSSVETPQWKPHVYRKPPSSYPSRYYERDRENRNRKMDGLYNARNEDVMWRHNASYPLSAEYFTNGSHSNNEEYSSAPPRGQQRRAQQSKEIENNRAEPFEMSKFQKMFLEYRKYCQKEDLNQEEASYVEETPRNREFTKPGPSSSCMTSYDEVRRNSPLFIMEERYMETPRINHLESDSNPTYATIADAGLDEQQTSFTETPQLTRNNLDSRGPNEFYFANRDSRRNSGKTHWKERGMPGYDGKEEEMCSCEEGKFNNGASGSSGRVLLLQEEVMSFIDDKTPQSKIWKDRNIVYQNIQTNDDDSEDFPWFINAEDNLNTLPQHVQNERSPEDVGAWKIVEILSKHKNNSREEHDKLSIEEVKSRGTIVDNERSKMLIENPHPLDGSMEHFSRQNLNGNNVTMSDTVSTSQASSGESISPPVLKDETSSYDSILAKILLEKGIKQHDSESKILQEKKETNGNEIPPCTKVKEVVLQHGEQITNLHNMLQYPRARGISESKRTYIPEEMDIKCHHSGEGEITAAGKEEEERQCVAKCEQTHNSADNKSISTNNYQTPTKMDIALSPIVWKTFNTKDNSTQTDKVGKIIVADQSVQTLKLPNELNLFKRYPVVQLGDCNASNIEPLSAKQQKFTAPFVSSQGSDETLRVEKKDARRRSGRVRK